MLDGVFFKIRRNLYKLIPKLRILKRYRDKLKSPKRFVSVQERKQGFSIGRSRIRPWAFIRAYNEIHTAEQSLRSIEGVIEHGVIAYHDCSDGTEDVILQFCKRNPGFIPAKYPYRVLRPDSPELVRGHYLYEESLAAYYTFALSHIPPKEWLIKVDLDLVFSPDLLDASFYLPQTPSDWVSYSRLNIADLDGDVGLLDYVRPGDHFLVRNDALKFVNTRWVDRRTGKVYYHESLRHKKFLCYCPECSVLHFPFHKSWRRVNSLTGFRPLSDIADIVPTSERDDAFLCPENIERIFKSLRSLD